MALIYNGSQINSLVWNGTETTGVWNGEVVWGSSPYHTLTLLTDGNGTLTAETLTGYPGDTVALTPTYNTYYRFDNYSNTGGSIDGNVFTFGDSDATVQANFKVNAFTASGGWQKGTSVNIINFPLASKKANVGNFYATGTSHTGEIPNNWYDSNNVWNPSNASAYNVSINFTTKFYCHSLANHSPAGYWASIMSNNTTLYNNTQISKNEKNIYTYTFNSSTNIQGNYYLSGYISGHNGANGNGWCSAAYSANNTTGSWTATGIAP